MPSRSPRRRPAFPPPPLYPILPDAEADDGPPNAVLAEMQSTTKELAEKVGGAVAGAAAAVLDSARSSLGGVLELAPKKTRTGKHKKKIKSKSAVKKARKREAKAAASAAAVAAAPATPPKRKTPPAREEPTAADAAALPAFAVGARVEAKWGWQWSRAVIDGANGDGTYDVEWVGAPDVLDTGDLQLRSLAEAAAYDAQAIGRVRRFPQTREVVVYRLYVQGTIEEELLAAQGVVS